MLCWAACTSILTACGPLATVWTKDWGGGGGEWLMYFKIR